ncbi:MAG: FAD-dependent 5-carboxymethylaminomethyl-2-thiouridine(34) oxidoreductase MnmC, partial [Moraxellaceae bacterium]
HLLATPGITLRTEARVAALATDDDGDWLALGAEGTCLASAPVLVLAGGLGMRMLPEARGLPLKPVRGQISRVPPSPASRALRTVLCYGGYLSPLLPGDEHCLGATFQPGREDVVETEEDHRQNRAGLRQLLPALADSLPATSDWQGRAALRCQSPDYLPMVGPLGDVATMAADYAGLADGRVQHYPPLAVRPGLYANLAHGAKGFTNALLSAEILAAELCGEPAPVSRACLDALHPMRFVIRALRRRQPLG